MLGINEWDYFLYSMGTLSHNIHYLTIRTGMTPGPLSTLLQIILTIRKEYKTSFYAQLYFFRRGKTVTDFLLCPTAENIIVLHLPNDVKTLIYAGSESS